jgi:hypothetical protein
MFWTKSLARRIPRRDRKLKALKKSLVLSAYYVAPTFGALTAKACRRDFGRPFLQGNETDASQVRSEIWNRPPHQQNFAVQRGDETRDGHAFQRGDLLENVPKYPFEPDTRALPIEPN